MSLYVLFESVKLTDQPFRKKTGLFFINLQKKYFKTKHNQNVKVERNILAYSLLLILREFLRLEKLSKQDLLMLIIFATAHYIRLIDGEDKEKMELGYHVRDIYDDNYNLSEDECGDNNGDWMPSSPNPAYGGYDLCGDCNGNGFSKVFKSTLK